MQTALIGGLFIMLTPIISAVAYESGHYDNASAQVKAIIDAIWSFGIALAVIAMGGNVLWYFNALKNRESVVV